MKKLIAGAGLLAVLLGTAVSAETLKLVEVITSPERTEVLKGMVDGYKAANPGVDVEIISIPWGQAFETVATMIAGGDTPDVIEMPDTWQALYADQLMPLDERVAAWEHGATLTQKTIDMGKLANGKITMIPYGFYLRAMFYNKKLLAEAGVAEPPKTMDEFMAASEAVSKLDGKYGYCLRGGPGGGRARPGSRWPRRSSGPRRGAPPRSRATGRPSWGRRCRPAWSPAGRRRRAGPPRARPPHGRAGP